MLNAVQINFAANETKLMGRSDNICYQYLLEYSTDKKNRKTLTGKTQSKAGEDPLQRLNNYKVPDGTFALSGLRVFGHAGGKSSAIVENLDAERQTDRCAAKLNWPKQQEPLDILSTSVRQRISCVIATGAGR